MIEFVSGDFFDYDANIRINTVNCVGVMGAGVALEFKNRYPEMFKAYVKVCKEKELEPGKPYVWEEYDLFSRCIIINLPTKIHWKDPSEYEYIEKDLLWLKKYLIDENEECVVTLPALGCGHGGLDWSIVKKQIEHYLGELHAKILVFEPASSNIKFKNHHYGLKKLDNNIEIVCKGEEKYPFVNSIDNELYCKGNTDILLLKRLSIICGNSMSEKEVSAIIRIVEELSTKNCAVVIGLNNKQHLELAKSLLDKGNKLILVIPYGITKFKYDLELKQYLDSVLVLSYVMPNQEFKRFEYINSLKHRCEIADAILYASEKLNDIRRDVKIIRQYNMFFYINYWTENIFEFSSINAIKVGINPETKRPNVSAIEKVLSH